MLPGGGHGQIKDLFNIPNLPLQLFPVKTVDPELIFPHRVGDHPVEPLRIQARHIQVKSVKIHVLFKPVSFKEDRKSTRLNSSHVKISYAVFCLKKKKP